MKTYGLIGFPLTHSFSVEYFAGKFRKEGLTDSVYKNFPLQSIEELTSLLRSENLSGLNVTIPYKESVIEYLDEMEETAQLIGAVNCIKIQNGKLTGYNTDVYAFRETLKSWLNGQIPDALILGTGGSSKAVSFALNQLGINYCFVSRRKKAEWLTYHELSEAMVMAHKLIINTTPIGMFPDSEGAPAIPYEAIGKGHFLYDLIYNPPQTKFLLNGGNNGAGIKNGLEMLYLQAEKNWAIWNQ